ncbi:hypothetical protein AMTRI_Chr03g44350 [Amborella trichopoda]
MIFVGGLAFSSSSEGYEDLRILLEHPTLVSATNCFKSIPERKISFCASTSERHSSLRHVYVFQREYATVNPSLVELVGTDEATTCVGLVVRNRKSGFTSVGHLDSPGLVDSGLSQMLSSVTHEDVKAELDVHLIGGYEDAPYEHSGTNSERSDGYSWGLCPQIIEALQDSATIFHLQTLCLLRHNTQYSDGVALPIIRGFVVEPATGTMAPAIFDSSSRCPDEVLRRVRITVSSEDVNWTGKLLETYDTDHDRFQIAPVSWHQEWKFTASLLLQHSDSQMLIRWSTSPYAEAPDFVKSMRMTFSYLVRYPDWQTSFPKRQPRVFKRIDNGGWEQCQ